jgi:hypothetical protein
MQGMKLIETSTPKGPMSGLRWPGSAEFLPSTPKHSTLIYKFATQAAIDVRNQPHSSLYNEREMRAEN